MTVEHRSAEPAKHMRIREYGGPFDLPPSRVGDVLGILDADGDGWAEILVTAHGYEGHSITAYEYSPQALEPTGAGFHWAAERSQFPQFEPRRTLRQSIRALCRSNVATARASSGGLTGLAMCSW